MTSDTRPPRSPSWMRTAVAMLLTSVVVAAFVAWPAPRGHTDITRIAGVELLSDAQMRAVTGGFTPPKGKRSCRPCNCPQYDASDPLCVQGQEGDGKYAPRLDPGSGNLSDTVPAPMVSAVGGGLSLSFRYDSDLADGTNSPLNLNMGYGWTHTYEMGLMESGADMAWLKGDGTVSFFDGGPLGFVGMPGEFARLQRLAPGIYEIRTTSGIIYRFSITESGVWPGARHLLTSITDANGRVTSLLYNGLNRLASVTDPFGNAIVFGYDPQGRLAIVTDPLGRVTTFGYDGQGQLGRITLPDGTEIRYLYDAARRMTRKAVIDPCVALLAEAGPAGARSIFGDADAGLSHNTAGSGSQAPAKQLGPSPCPENEVYVIAYDPLTGRTSELRDLNGDLIFTVPPGSGWHVDLAQSLLSGEMRYMPGTMTVVDGRGQPWTYTYDDRGQITRIEAPLVSGQPAITQYVYDSSTRRVQTATDPLGRVTQYAYDSFGNNTVLTDEQGNVTQMEYSHPTIYSLITRKIEPDGDVWVWQYDASGNMLKEIDPQYGPGGPSTTYSYDGIGRRATMTDRNGHVTSYQYDAQSRLIQRTIDPGGLGLTTQYQYDPVGNRTTEIDPRGITTRYDYDSRDRMIHRTRDPGGSPHLNYTTNYQYDGRGNQISMTDPNGHTTTYQYDYRDRVTRTTDALGHDTTTTYDGTNRRLTTTDVNGNVTTYGYDNRGRLSQTVEDAGPSHQNITTHYQYDAADNRIRITRDMDPGDGPARVTEYQYDSLNRVTRLTLDPAGLGLVTQYDYAPPGGGGCGCNGTPGGSQIHQVTDPDGRVTYYHYDKLDRQTKLVRKIGDIADNGGDADDAITTMTYDPVGNIVSSFTEADPNPDMRTEFTYDAANRLVTRTTDPGIPPSHANLTTQFVYDGNANVIQSTRPNGDIITSVYDAADRRISRTDSLGSVMTYQYDGVGNVVRQTDGNGNGNTTPHAYDALDRPTTRYDSQNAPTTYQYDNLNNVLRTTDRNGHVTTYTYDGAYRRTAEIRAATGGAGTALNIRTEYTYDDARNLRTIRAYNQNQSGPEVQVTEYQYDAANRRIREIYPDDENGRPRDLIYTYDGASNVISRTDQNRDVTHYAYDSLSRLTQRSYSIDAGSPTYPPAQLPDVYAYDRASRTISGVHHYAGPDPDVSATAAYDGAGRIVQTTQDARTIQYSYQVDPLTSRVETTYPSGRVVRADYDRRDRLDRVTDQPSNALISDRDYDPGNRLIHQLNGNTSTTDYQYNPNNWPTRITHSTGVPFIDLEYGYDGVGNMLYTQRNHAPDTSELFVYDSADRLVDFKRGTLLPNHSDVSAFTSLPSATQRQLWTLDAVANWLIAQTRISAADACAQRFANKANEYTAVEPNQACPPPGGPPIPLAYDDNGNLINDPLAGPGGVGLHFQYDVEGRLTRMTRLSDNAVIAQYHYDAYGRRVRKVVTNSGALNGTTHSLMSDRWQTLAEYDSAGALLREFTYGAYLDDPLTIDRNINGDGTTIGPADQRLYYHAGRLCSVHGLSDAAGGLVEAYLYDPFGRQVVINDGNDADGIVNFSPNDLVTVQGRSEFDNPWTYTGRQFDAESGLCYFRARYYQAEDGEFLSRDPTTLSAGRMGPYVQRRPFGMNPGAYRDGDSLYRAYFVPNALDPMGERVTCSGLSGFAAYAVAISGSVYRCRDNCCPSRWGWVVCVGLGGGVGASIGAGPTVGEGCLGSGFSGQLTIQGVAGVVGISGSGNLGSGEPSGGVSYGPGAGAAGTIEGCHTW